LIKNDKKRIKIELIVDQHILITENMSRFNFIKAFWRQIKKVKMIINWSKIVIKRLKMIKN